MAIVDGHIRCSRCRELKPLAAFSASSASNGCGNCRVCQQLYSRAYAKANPGKVRAQRRSKYRSDIDASRARQREKAAARRAANREGDRAYQRAYYHKNVDRMRELAAEYYKRNPGARREYELKKYGMTSAAYEVLLASQGGKCACCGRSGNRSGKPLFVDHDHSTGAVRGLLCTSCNTGIGALGDTAEGIRRALNYLERAQQPPMRATPAIRINLLQGAN